MRLRNHVTQLLYCDFTWQEHSMFLCSTRSNIKTLLTLQFRYISTIYFDTGRQFGHAYIYVQTIYKLYSIYAYIAFRENWHISTEAQLILNKFQVYKTLPIQINVIDQKENHTQNRNQTIYFLYFLM